MNRFVSDLVKDDSPDRNIGVENLHHVPADALSLAIFVRGEQQLVGVLQRIFERLDVFLAVTAMSRRFVPGWPHVGSGWVQ